MEGTGREESFIKSHKLKRPKPGNISEASLCQQSTGGHNVPTQHAQCIHMQLYRAGKELEGQKRREYESWVFLYGHGIVVYFSYVLNVLFLSTHGYCHCRTVSNCHFVISFHIVHSFYVLRVYDQAKCIATPFKRMQALDFDEVDDEDGYVLFCICLFGCGYKVKKIYETDNHRSTFAFFLFMKLWKTCP
uniref:Uncharacterized protein n=1 Tax=Glossina palpalis gambiensis TaxID=67801 RepID=A0A1B0BJS8_9MUSC